MQIYRRILSDHRTCSKYTGLVGIGTTSPVATLDVKGNAPTSLTGTVSATSGSAAVTGVGSAFDTELAVGDAIKIVSNVYTVSSIASATSLTLTSNASANAAGVTAYKDAALLSVQNAAATTKLTVDKTGNVGIGTTSPAFLLDVAGGTSRIGGVYMTTGGGIYSAARLGLGVSSSTGIDLIPNTNQSVGGTVNHISARPAFSPTSGTATFNGFGIYPTINTTGTYAGEVTSFKISPYILSATGISSNYLLDVGTNSAASGGGTHTSALVVTAAGKVGIGIASPVHTLDIVGTAGLSTGTAWTNTSDGRLKDIQGEYGVGLTEVMKLRPVRFTYKKDNALGIPVGKERTGFIAQEVRDVIPEAVVERENGYLELNVDPIHWAVVNAVRELKAEKDAEIARLKADSQKKDGEIGQLKAYICGKDPSAALCN